MFAQFAPSEALEYIYAMPLEYFTGYTAIDKAVEQCAVILTRFKGLYSYIRNSISMCNTILWIIKALHHTAQD